MSWLDLIQAVWETQKWTIVVALVGIPAGAYASMKITIWRQRPKLRHHVECTVLIDESTMSLPDLEVRLAGTKLPVLSRSRVLLWNDGTQSLRTNDLTKKDPLRVQARNDITILGVIPLGVTKDASDVTVSSTGNNSRRINFDHLDPRDGAGFEVLHTGRSHDDIDINGTIVGAKASIREGVRARSKSRIARGAGSLAGKLQRSQLFRTLFSAVLAILSFMILVFQPLSVFGLILMILFVLGFGGGALYFGLQHPPPKAVWNLPPGGRSVSAIEL